MADRNRRPRNRTARPNAAGQFQTMDLNTGGGRSRAAGRTPDRRRSQQRRRRRKKRRMSTGKKVALGICTLLLVLVVGAIGVVASKLGKLNIASKFNPDELSISSDLDFDESGYLNVALFGLDTRTDGGESGVEGCRSDAIMVASLNRKTKEIKIASIYRDTLLSQNDAGTDFNKANAAYSLGYADNGSHEEAAKSAIQMLNRNLDLNIQNYVTVDFSAMVDVIDALGGVEIDVTEEEIPYLNNYSVEIIENTGVDTWAVTKPGLQNLTGVQATAYARIRYTDGNDFKRAERQRLVLSKIAEKAQKANISTLNKIVDKVFPKVHTSFSLTEILAYAKDVSKYKMVDSIGFPEEKYLTTMIYGDVGDSVIPNTLVDGVTVLQKYLFGSSENYTPSADVKKYSKDIEGILQNGYLDTSGTSDGSSYDSGSYDSGSYDSGTYYDDGSGTYDSSGSYDSGSYDTGGTGYDTGSGTTDSSGSGTDSTGGTGYNDTSVPEGGTSYDSSQYGDGTAGGSTDGTGSSY